MSMSLSIGENEVAEALLCGDLDLGDLLIELAQEAFSEADFADFIILSIGGQLNRMQSRLPEVQVDFFKKIIGLAEGMSKSIVEKEAL